MFISWLKETETVLKETTIFTFSLSISITPSETKEEEEEEEEEESCIPSRPFSLSSMISFSISSDGRDKKIMSHSSAISCALEAMLIFAFFSLVESCLWIIDIGMDMDVDIERDRIRME